MAASRAAHLPHILRASRQVTAAAWQNAACRRVFCALVLPVGEIVLPHVRQNGLARTAYRAPRERRLD